MRPHPLTRLLTITALATSLAAGCSGDDDTATTTTPGTTPPTTTVPTTTPPTTTAPPSTPPPSEPVSTTQPPTTTQPGSTLPTTTAPGGAPDFVQIVGELAALQIDLQLAPDLDRVLDYCHESGSCRTDMTGLLTNMLEDDAHGVNLPIDPVISVEVTTTNDDVPVEQAALVGVLAEFEATPVPDDARIVNSAGETLYKITSDIPPGTLYTRSFLLGKNLDGDWRVVQQIEAG